MTLYYISFHSLSERTSYLYIYVLAIVIKEGRHLAHHNYWGLSVSERTIYDITFALIKVDNSCQLIVISVVKTHEHKKITLKSYKIALKFTTNKLLQCYTIQEAWHRYKEHITMQYCVPEGIKGAKIHEISKFQFTAKINKSYTPCKISEVTRSLCLIWMVENDGKGVFFMYRECHAPHGLFCGVGSYCRTCVQKKIDILLLARKTEPIKKIKPISNAWNVT